MPGLPGMSVQSVPGVVLVILGAGFLLANARLLVDYVSFLRRRRAALLTWPSPRPPYYGMALAIGVVMGLSPSTRSSCCTGRSSARA